VFLPHCSVEKGILEFKQQDFWAILGKPGRGGSTQLGVENSWKVVNPTS
jgi:hypothetical protein